MQVDYLMRGELLLSYIVVANCVMLIVLLLLLLEWSHVVVKSTYLYYQSAIDIQLMQLTVGVASKKKEEGGDRSKLKDVVV